MPDVHAEAAAEGRADAVERAFLRETSLVHVTRVTIEAHTQDTRRRISGRRRYRPPKGGDVRPDLRRERKELAGG